MEAKYNSTSNQNRFFMKTTIGSKSSDGYQCLNLGFFVFALPYFANNYICLNQPLCLIS